MSVHAIAQRQNLPGPPPCTASPARSSSETMGLYHFSARFYDPNTARWTKPEPINRPADLRQANLYTYAGGNPINYTDPTGLRVWGDVKQGFGKVARRAPAACYVYNATTDKGRRYLG
jgi:RHS repeat-associated protein